MPIIPALGKLRQQGHHEFETSLGYREISFHRKSKSNWVCFYTSLIPALEDRDRWISEFETILVDREKF